MMIWFPRAPSRQSYYTEATLTCVVSKRKDSEHFSKHCIWLCPKRLAIGQYRSIYNINRNGARCETAESPQQGIFKMQHESGNMILHGHNGCYRVKINQYKICNIKQLVCLTGSVISTNISLNNVENWGPTFLRLPDKYYNGACCNYIRREMISHRCYSSGEAVLTPFFGRATVNVCPRNSDLAGCWKNRLQRRSCVPMMIL